MPWKSAIASIGVGLVNNALSQNNAQDQRDWQYMMWNEQNKYNHPAAQADRMRVAGLNPYLIQGAEPAGSVGTGATAQTIPLENPLAYAKTFAEIDNLNATTTKIDTETDELLKRISLLELQKRYQVITNEKFEREVKELFEEWDKRNPFTLEADKTESEIDKNIAETKEAEERAKKQESDRLFTEALTETENAMRDVRVNLAKAQAAAANASARADLAQASKLILEGKTVELQNQRDAFRNSAMEFYGFDPTTMPPELSATLMNNFAVVVEHNWDNSYAKDAMDKCHALLEAYRGKSVWTPTSESQNWSGKVKIPYFEISGSYGSSISN